jgi:hypothetical protein
VAENKRWLAYVFGVGSANAIGNDATWREMSARINNMYSAALALAVFNGGSAQPSRGVAFMA